ncbi:MAG: tetratricopeptide repeat protein [Deltaproteobacteria bacterium]|nr:tetratricopeptide repeat protein [Deltaproteobacteria bacterium]
MGEERAAAYYDEVHGRLIGVPAPDKPWFPIWKAVAEQVLRLEADLVIDLGCGTGELASVLSTCVPDVTYWGCDFSAVAIEQARSLELGERYGFEERDLRAGFPIQNRDGGRVVYVCCEILEHIQWDLTLLARVPDGAHVIATVPDFDDPGHVRHFSSAREASERYMQIVDVVHTEDLATGHHFMLEGRRREHAPGITLAMIARDEETGIGRAIESAAGIVDDVVVLVDEATTDRTAKIARGLGARVIGYRWSDDFAAARNSALEHVRTPWVLWLDGHEHLRCGPGEIGRGMRADPGAAGFWIEVEMEGGSRHRHVRLHRAKGARWRNPVHNILDVDGPVASLSGPVVVHDRYSGQSRESRARRNAQRDEHVTAILEERIREDPKDTRSMFYLGQQHRDAGRWEAAHYWYERYGRTEGGNQWPEESLIAAANAGRAALMLGDLEAALECAHRAVLVMPDRAECRMLEGDVHYARRMYAEALTAFEQAEACAPPAAARLWVDRSIHQGGWKVLDNISMCCWHLGEHARGASLCERLLSMDELPAKERPRVEDNLGWHRGKLDGDG